MQETTVRVPESALPMIHALGLVSEHFESRGTLDRATFHRLCSEAKLASQLAISQSQDCRPVSNPFLL